MDYAPLMEKIYNDYYFQDILRLGISVEYWDVSFVIAHHSELIPFHKDEVSKKFLSRQEFRKEVKNSDKETLFIPLMTYNGLVLSLFLILSFYKCKLAYFGVNTIPAPTFSSKRVLEESKLNGVLIKRVLLNKLSIIFKKIGLVKNADYIFASGTKGLEGFGRTTRNELSSAQIIDINSSDYDKCLLSNNEYERVIEGEYAVFLDEYLPFHPDVSIIGLNVIDSDYYYTYLNRFFDLIEQSLGVPVIIAAHPKAEKYKLHNYFNGRKIVFYKTTQLCKYATLVLAHDSTSINNAVFFNRPILLMLYRKMQLENMFTFRSTLAFAEALHAQTIYVDDDYNKKITIPRVDSTCYDGYKYRYMTSPKTRDVDSKTVLLNFLRTME